ncbi:MULTISPECIES: helix-turn-helix domain-containing protein [Cyanophyceae]|uniref:AraC family transcriptional regulator n=1 Tax=Leptolyngbya subtilissima DQ-A4 TaxID=2933933 RepID=A0ABV0K8U0_9CYAN|nr:AraC family transcriptional regulator [Nodosilinea sp. FACHB-141]MBD2110311.1 helix-turn-helix transcriptional regulator [Nodosilinea sp. FACHB-141]
MTIILSEPPSPVAQPIPAVGSGSRSLGSFELVISAPGTKSQGCKRSLNLRHGLNLLIRDYWLEDVLIEENSPEASGRTLEFGFNLCLGDNSDRHSSLYGPNSFLQYEENRTISDTQTWPLKGRVLKIDLHLRTQPNSQSFSPDQLDVIPSEVQELIARHNDHWYQPLETIAPSIQLVLQQILNCPYTGSIQQVYLEGKALELIALQTAQWLEAGPSRLAQRLKPSDIDRIHQARDLVAQRLDDPLSLLELARAVGLNDCTLKRGFRQVLGTTVFGYLRQQRLIKARQLLQDTEMSVAEVTYQVGYSHAGHFAAAFKREFGVSPKAFKNSVL